MYKKSDVSNKRWMTFNYDGKNFFFPYDFKKGDIAFLALYKQITREVRIVDVIPVADIPSWDTLGAFTEFVTAKREQHDVVKVFSAHGSVVLLTADIIGVNYNISRNDFKDIYHCTF